MRCDVTAMIVMIVMIVMKGGFQYFSLFYMYKLLSK